MDAIQIQPASFDQLVRAKDGRLVGISDDVGGVAQQLREIDPGFRLAYSEAEDITIVSHDDGDSEELKFTAKGTPDHRIVQRAREIASPGYDFLADLEATDRAAEKARYDQFREKVGDAGERLAYALRKDLHVENRVFISGKNAR
jgi:hypothetical protein